MEKIKITNHVPYFCWLNATEFNCNQYKRIYEYFLILNGKCYNFKRKKYLKAFLYERIRDKTYHNKNEIDEQRVSCIVTKNDVVKVHVYDLFSISSFWDNY